MLNLCVIAYRYCTIIYCSYKYKRLCFTVTNKRWSNSTCRFKFCSCCSYASLSVVLSLALGVRAYGNLPVAFACHFELTCCQCMCWACILCKSPLLSHPVSCTDCDGTTFAVTIINTVPTTGTKLQCYNTKLSSQLLMQSNSRPMIRIQVTLKGASFNHVPKFPTNLYLFPPKLFYRGSLR